MNRETKKQVLVFMLAPPLPAVAGGDIYAVNALQPFAEEIDYHLFCFVGGEEDARKVVMHRAQYDAVFRSIHLEPRPPMPFQMRRWLRVLHLVGHSIRGLPFIDASYCSSSALSAAKRIVRERHIDALEVNSAHLAFFRKYLDLPAILIGHNIESDIFPFWIPAGLRGWRLRLVEWVAGRSRRAAHAVEVDNVFGFRAMTFISPQDMQRVTADVPKLLMPLYFSKQAIPYDEKPADRFNVLWMGGFGWYPNAEGVRWFAQEVYPNLVEHLESANVCLHFCGSNPPDELRALHDGVRVYVHGFVDDIDAMLRDAHLLMVPLLTGGGIRVKIIEAMSSGVPVLSTSKGCEGIAAEDGVDIIVCNEACAFAEQILSAAQQPSRMAKISAGGLDLMARCYSKSASLAAKRKAYGFAGVL